VRRAVEAGAVGFVPKASSPALLIDALRLCAHGGVYLPLAALQTDDEAPTPTELRSLAQAFPALTERQHEVLDWLARGMSNKQIARALDVAEGTVKQHLNAIFRELGVNTRTEAVYLMARRGVKFA
jgi:two-component system, NarL family, nitrate/nitrite response regulator NarL